MKKNFTSNFLIFRRKVNMSNAGGFTLKHESWKKKCIFSRLPLLSYYTNDLRDFVDAIKHSSKEKLKEPKIQLRLCVMLLITFPKSLYGSEEEERKFLKIWQEWINHYNFSSWMAIQHMKKPARIKFG